MHEVQDFSRLGSYKARTTVKRAIAKGKLRRPKKCSRCGARPGLDAQGNPMIQAFHHKGYAKEHRLDVIWVCVSCRNRAVWVRKHAEQKRQHG